MSHIFISYSRKDLDFAGKIVQALAKNKLDTWVDWKSIPKGEKWLEEIYHGIEGADAFLFLISPDSVISDNCNKEIAHAVKNGKRILPIVIRDTDLKIIHPEISKRNWIFCREGYDFHTKPDGKFDKVFDTIIKQIRETIHTDYEWLKFHTELQVKALKWEQKKDNSRLLRGKDLREAEERLAEAVKEPQPTDLQRHYLLISTRNEERQRRQVTIGLSLGLVIMAIITIFAWAQRNEAQRQTKIALSRQLAAQALVLESSQFDLSALLSIEALNISDNGDTRNSLLTGLQNHPQLIRYMSGHTGSVIGVAFGSDGKTILSAGEDDQIILWDIATGQQLRKIASGYGSNGVSSMSLSPDGKILATAGGWDNPSIILWDVATLQPIGLPLIGHTGYVSSIIFSPNGKFLASASYDNTVILWSVQTHETTSQVLAGNTNRVVSIAFSPDSKLLVSSAGDGLILLWDVATHQMINKSDNKSTDVLLFSPDGKMLVSGGHDEEYNTLIQLWDVKSFSVIHSLSEEFGWVTSLAFSSDGKLLASGNCRGAFMGGSCDQGNANIVIWNIETGKTLGAPLLGHKDGVNSVAFSPDNKILASASFDNTIIIWEVEPSQPLGTILSSDNDENFNIMAFSPNGQTLALGDCHQENEHKECLQGEIRFWDVITRQYANFSLLGHSNDVLSLAFSPDGQTLASVGRDGTIILWDLKTHKPIDESTFAHPGMIANLTFCPNGKFLAASNDESIIVWNLEKSAIVGSPLILSNQDVAVSGEEFGGARKIAFSPDDRILAAGYYGDIIYLWDLTTHISRKLEKDFFDERGTTTKIVFSADGKLLASSNGRQGLLWDITKGELVGSPLTTSSIIEDLAFSPDGKMLVLSNWDANTIWDLATQRQIGLPFAYLNYKYSNRPHLSFNPVENVLISVNSDGLISLWDIGINSWKTRACDIVARNLNHIEWNQYIGKNILYRPTCPNFPIPTE